MREKAVKIKLCGLRRTEDIAYVNAAHPEFAGMILAQGRKRTVTVQKAFELAKGLEAGIAKVGVFLDQDPDWIAQAAREIGLDWVQLHGSESEKTIRRLQEELHLPVIKAFRIESRADVERARYSPARLVLLDHGAGGSGEAFDWSLIRSLDRPFLLAGGLGPGNVKQALETTRPWGVDVSSGVETEGVKDPDKIAAFVRAVRQMS